MRFLGRIIEAHKNRRRRQAAAIAIRLLTRENHGIACRCEELETEAAPEVTQQAWSDMHAHVWDMVEALENAANSGRRAVNWTQNPHYLPQDAALLVAAREVYEQEISRFSVILAELRGAGFEIATGFAPAR